MISFYHISEENIKDHNQSCSKILNHLYRKLITWGSGFGKTNSFNLISFQPDVDNIYLYATDPYKAKYLF